MSGFFRLTEAHPPVAHWPNLDRAPVASVLSYKMRTLQALTQTLFVQCPTKQHRLKTL